MFEAFLKQSQFNENTMMEKYFDKEWHAGQVQLKPGHIVEATEQYIVNTVHTQNVCDNEMTKNIFQKFPHADIYKTAKPFDLKGKSMRDQIMEKKKFMSKLGDIQIMGNGKDQRYVINIFNQLYPDIEQFKTMNDTLHSRLNYFGDGLDKIAKIKNLESLAFAEKIGVYCQGTVCETSSISNSFLEKVKNFAKINSKIKVAVYVSLSLNKKI